MLAEERAHDIQRRLKRDGRVVAAELAQEFGVSEDTIRRDLRDLAKAGLCRKVYGGALLAAEPPPYAGTIAQRSATGTDEKARLATAAAGLIRPGQMVFLDAGSTNLAIAAAIPRDMALTVVTNAPAIALTLADHAPARIILLGGVFDAERGGSFGATAIAALQQINADIFFVGACGLHGETGVTALDPSEADLKRAMARQSARLVVVVTAEKMGTMAPFQVIPAESVDDLVAMRKAERQTIAIYERLGCNVHLVN